MKNLNTLLSAILAGMCVGLGGVAFLAVDSKVLGAALFTVGLFTICTFGLNLFTGKVCYVLEHGRHYALALPVIWVGNLLGTGLTALLARLGRSGGAMAEKAAGMCAAKTQDSFLSLFVLGVLCNILIYIAVEGFRSNPHELGKYLSLLFGVMVFILGGTEHCVADMFYYWVAGAWSARAVAAVLVITLGNAVGGVFFAAARRYLQDHKTTE